DGKHYYMDESDDFVSGIKNLAADNTIPDTAIIGGNRLFAVEDQDTDAPPSSPGLGVYWIIGDSPTGAWSGHTGEIATSYDGVNWTFISPVEGWLAYDKDQNAFFQWSGSGWVVAFGAWVNTLLMERSTNLSNTSTSASFVVASQTQ